MKKAKFIFGAILLLSLGSCASDLIITKDVIDEKTSEYEIDVIESFIDCKGLDNYRLIEPANARIGAIIDSLMYDTKSQAISYFSRRSSRKRPAFKYQLVSRDTLFSATNKIISARILAYTFTGGAHGATRFYSVNYSPEIGSFLKLQDILDLSKTAEIDVLIQKHFNNENGAFNKQPTLELAATVNISKTSVIFTYEHYVLGPYSSGYAVVEVPRKEIKEFLNI